MPPSSWNAINKGEVVEEDEEDDVLPPELQLRHPERHHRTGYHLWFTRCLSLAAGIGLLCGLLLWTFHGRDETMAHPQAVHLATQFPLTTQFPLATDDGGDLLLDPVVSDSALELDLGFSELPIIGEGERWRRPDEQGVLFNMRNAAVSSAFDTGCMSRLVPIPDAKATSYQITKLAPYTSMFVPADAQSPEEDGGYSIVHHMDVFVCGEEMDAAPGDAQCLTDSWLTPHGPCYAMLWAYDKGAVRPHELPSDAGFRVGRGTPWTKLLLQIHFLLPRRLARTRAPPAVTPGRVTGIVPSEVRGADGESSALSDAERSNGGSGSGNGNGNGIPLDGTAAVGKLGAPFRASDLIQAGYHDTSGVRVTLATGPAIRVSDAWTFEFISYNVRAVPWLSPGPAAWPRLERLSHAAPVARLMLTPMCVRVACCVLLRVACAFSSVSRVRPPPCACLLAPRTQMDVPPGARDFEYATRLPHEAAVQMMADDFAFANGTLRLRQVHTHAHRHATRVSLHRIGPDGSETELISLAPYCGYGPCQQFHELPNGSTMARGDALEMRCVYDNAEPVSLSYGVSQMQEMCGAVVVYTPHDPSASPNKQWFDSADGRQRVHAGSGRWSRAPFGNTDG